MTIREFFYIAWQLFAARARFLDDECGIFWNGLKLSKYEIRFYRNAWARKQDEASLPKQGYERTAVMGFFHHQ